MDIAQTQRISAPRQAVWNAVMDPEVLRRCIPGCEEIEKTSDTEMAAVVALKIGPVKARFKGKVAFKEMLEPQFLTLAGEGTGGVAGYARGSARVTLDEDGGETVLSYDVTAQVGGKIAQLGSRLVDSTARKLSAEFFDRLQKEFATDAAGAENTPEG